MDTMCGETVFIENVQVSGGDAEVIHCAIKRMLSERKVIGLGSDGASVSTITYHVIMGRHWKMRLHFAI
jgi:hypothetical protein